MTKDAPDDTGTTEEIDHPDRARWGFPAFARTFPRDPALDALVAAFADGNFARVREDAPGVIASSEHEDVRSSAALLLDRTRPDPRGRWLFAFAALLLAALTGWWILHDGPPRSGMNTEPAGPVRIHH